MSHSTTSGGAHAGPTPEDPTVGALVHRLTEQVPELIRSEMRLAQAELAQKGKKAGLGVGVLSAAALLGYFGLALLVVTAVLALDLVLPAWAAALIVAGVMFVAAAVAGLAGKKKVEQATPAAPEHAIAGLKQDVATVKGARS